MSSNNLIEQLEQLLVQVERGECSAADAIRQRLATLKAAASPTATLPMVVPAFRPLTERKPYAEHDVFGAVWLVTSTAVLSMCRRLEGQYVVVRPRQSQTFLWALETRNQWPEGTFRPITQWFGPYDTRERASGAARSRLKQWASRDALASDPA